MADLLDKIPPASRDYCSGLLEQLPIEVKLVRSRVSKWGDYRFGRSHSPRITLNEDLPPPFLLMTFIHELAHHVVQLKYGRRVAPHGKEWKHCFREMMLPLLNDEIFEAETLPLFISHMANPKANASADQRLHRLAQNMRGDEGFVIEALADGSRFVFRKKEYRRLHILRKRILCERLSDRRRYLFQPGTQIQPL